MNLGRPNSRIGEHLSISVDSIKKERDQMKSNPRFLWRSVIVLLLVGLCLSACQGAEPAASGGDQQSQLPPGEGGGLPNPASVYCQEKGYTLEIRTAEDGGQMGVCIFPDGSECDEWAFYLGECSPAGSTPTVALTPYSTTEPTPPQALDYAGWGEYANDLYGFSFRYPPEWALEEVQEADNTMSGHLIRLETNMREAKAIEMLIGFKRVGEDQLIWPTGVGEGEFVPRDAVLFIGEELKRNVLVCQDHNMNVFYQQEGGIRRGDLEFSLILGYIGSCLDQFSIPDEIQALADKVVISFELNE